MRSVVGLLGLVVVLAVGLFIYRSYFGASNSATTMGTNNVRAVADVTGVKNDLIAIAQAERQFMVLNGHYASLDELHSSGDLTVDPARGRLGYTYSATTEDRHFKVSATYSGPATGMPTLSIDENMQISQ